MDTDRQVFRHRHPTARAALGGATRKHLQKRAVSLCRFAARILEELTPGSISYTLVERPMPVGLHVRNVQIFTDDHLIAVDQLPTRFVRKVGTAVRDALMDMLDNPLGLAVCRRPLLLGTELALRLLQGLLVLAKKPWVVYRRGIKAKVSTLYPTGKPLECTARGH